MVNKVSWICPTYRRTEMLPDILDAFLAQEWDGEKELIILNDEPQQQLVCDHPEIKCYNWKWRIGSLGGKCNIACSLASGDLLMPTDDDDWYGPRRIADAVEGMAGGLYRAEAFVIDTEPPEVVRGLIHCNYAFTPNALIAAGTYNTSPRAQNDMRMLNIIEGQVEHWGLEFKQPPAPSYCYRRLAPHIHCSEALMGIGAREIPTGRIVLEPAGADRWASLNPVDQGRTAFDIPEARAAGRLSGFVQRAG